MAETKTLRCVGGPLDGQEVGYSGKRLTVKPKDGLPVRYVLRRGSQPEAGFGDDNRRSRRVVFRYELDLAAESKNHIPSRWNARQIKGKPTHV